MTHHLDFNRLIKVSKFLADLVEAIIKVVYIDKNHSIDIVHEIFKGLLDPMISLEILDVHPMTKLYEMCQKKISK
jgi:dsRNA-specific ribonuclease